MSTGHPLHTVSHTLAILHDDDQFVIDSEELLIPHQKGHLVLLYLIIELFQNADLPSTSSYLPVSSLDILFRHSFQEHLLGDEVRSILAFFAVVEAHLVDLTWVDQAIP